MLIIAKTTREKKSPDKQLANQQGCALSFKIYSLGEMTFLWRRAIASLWIGEDLWVCVTVDLHS